MNDLNKEIEEQEQEPKSKTQVKQEMQDLRDLGETLLDLPLSVYQTFPIPEHLDQALNAARKIKSHVAKRRQLQFIGKLMRKIDIAPIQEAYDEWKNGRKKLNRKFQQLEVLRDQLIANDSASIEKIINEKPQCDIQQLRQLIRLTQKEQQLAKPPKNYRKLFQFIKELYSEDR